MRSLDKNSHSDPQFVSKLGHEVKKSTTQSRNKYTQVKAYINHHVMSKSTLFSVYHRMK